MNSLTIKGGLVYQNGRLVPTDLHVREGKVATSSSGPTVHAENLWVLPGLVDAHVHFRDGTLAHKETFTTGAEAALAGGVTSCLVMANGDPITDRTEALDVFFHRTRGVRARLHPISAVTLGLEGKQLVDFYQMKKSGAVAFSDDGQSLMDTFLLAEALRLCEVLAMPIILHEEDRHLSPSTGAHFGIVGLNLGLPMSHACAETTLLARDLELIRALAPKAPVHIAHVSTLRSLELVQEARRLGLNVSCEVCPHHLYFEHRKVEEVMGVAKMSPPLRDEETRLGLWQALTQGHIDIIATDHAPHTTQEKNQGFADCPCGVAGIEMALSSLWTLCNNETSVFEKILPAMTTAPARRFGLKAGELREGFPADFVLFDPRTSWKVSGAELKTKAKHTPWEGETLMGRAMKTFVDGEEVFSR